MRLHSLTLQAIGPFAERYTVDFAALSAGGLFLLEGPTGAGKSTLIDAVVFALYGKVAAASASEDRLRSAFASEDTESVVDLCFETAHGVYRVRRTPAYDRAKKRGSGTVRQNSTVKLWRLTAVPDDPELEPVGEIVSTRLDEAGAELTAIVGLDRTQFVQTMVLPQGEFAGFLRAEPEHRRVLLQRIFGTEVYDRLEHRLDEERKIAQRAVESGRQAVQGAVDRFTGAAGTEAEAATALRELVDTDVSAAVDRVAEWVAEVEACADESAAEAVRAGTRAQQSGERAEAAAERVRRVERWSALIAERELLDGLADQAAQDRERLGLAQRSAAVAPLLTGWDEARERLAAALNDRDAVLDRAPDELPSAADEVLAWRDRARETVATLTRAVDLESGLDRRAATLEGLHTELVTCRATVTELDLLLAARPEERQLLVAELARLTELAHTVGLREHAWQAASAVLDAVREAARIDAERGQVDADRSAAARDALGAAERESALREARLRGIAGELAGALQPGEPCPVCGSVEHPQPRELTDGHVTAEQVQVAEQARIDAELRLREVETTLSALVSRAEAVAERTGGRQLADAEQEVTAAGLALDEARSARTDQEACAERVREHDRATQALDDRRAAAVEAARAAEQAVDHAARELDRDRAEVAAARAGHPTVAARQSVERARAEAADAVLDARARVRAADDSARDWQDRAAAALVEHGFLTDTDTDDHLTAAVERARAGQLGAGALATLEATVRARQTAVDRVATGLADPELADLDVGTVSLAADRDRLAAARAEAAEHRQLADAATGRAAADRRRAEQCLAAQTQVVQAAARAGDLLREAAPITRVARLASGQGEQGLSLGTYVLQRRFEDVVAAANDRLRQMSDGRFELVSSEERESRSRRLGLALKVIDHQSGDARNPKTLSGGETFYVSLCLALGLADVVTAEAGGIELGTLFIDEGFGSLDPHTLDAVLTELGHLRAGGRVVGLVSHVEAMKSAIAERITVRRRADGSSMLTVVAG